jgi:2-(1,2-epoxy-1,2-dihydrophenyl)acetyl-CoA isomerase
MPSVLVSIDSSVLSITLNRPEKLNAFNPDMHKLLRAAVERAAEDPQVRAVLLTGAGRGFCAGQDLSDTGIVPSEGPVNFGDKVERLWSPLIRRLTGFAFPTVCAVNGVAAGAGANLALACDLVLAARSASFIQSFSRIGLVPDSGGSYVLPRFVGTARAMGLALLGEKLSAEDAQRWGLIWQVFDDDALLPGSLGIAKNLACGPTKGYGLLKEAIYASAGNSLDTQLDLERDLQRVAGMSEDYREGVAAFKEKRKPVFKGR